MKKALPIRPSDDFTVDSYRWSLDAERQSVIAGYAPVGEGVLRRRFFQFSEFLWLNGMLIERVVASEQEVNLQTLLKNHHLNDKGFLFCQKFHGRWVDRASKDAGPDKEWSFLEKWLESLNGNA